MRITLFGLVYALLIAIAVVVLLREFLRAL